VETRKRRPALLGVTVLTSMGARALRETGVSGSPAAHVVALARLAKKAGLDGAVASGHEVRAIRRKCGPKFQILVPSVRPLGAAANDQARVATPAEATRARANFLVVGRPITAAKNPRLAALAILREIASASR
jgi:orotidine-5'-phosphate decarboxylase